MFTSEDHKEILDDMTGIEEQTKTMNRVLVELRQLLSQPSFAMVADLNELHELLQHENSEQFKVVKDNKSELLELVEIAQSNHQSLSDFKQMLFHLSRLVEAQARVVRLMKEVLGSPATFELKGLMDQEHLKDMCEIFMTG